MTNRILNLIALIVLFATITVPVFAQENGDVITPADEESHPTLFSVKLSSGYGIGRARQIYGFNGSDAVYWSTGQGVKMDMAFDVPLLPVEMINSDGEEYGPEKIPYVGLELELGTGYHISTGGTTVDGSSIGSTVTKRLSTYIPITLGLNARASFGPGLPSVYIGAGGGIHIKAIYEDNISYSYSSETITRTYDPPLPFELYGALGIEVPLMYSPDDGNSALDLFGQVRLTEATNYIYQYTQTSSSGSSTVVKLLGNTQAASNIAFSLGIKINIY
ncbi:MAG TPA: hypothetical protein VEW28_10050 [Candidatus Kapabacteria bacterium]|nr:hypothetical protein [Candidatus Kapabacteria bacterium]